MNENIFNFDCIEIDGHNATWSTPSLVTRAQEENDMLHINENWKLNAPISNGLSPDREYDMERIQVLSDEKVEIIPKSALGFQNNLNEVVNSSSEQTMGEQCSQPEQPPIQMHVILAQYYDVGNTRFFIIPQQQATTSTIDTTSVNNIQTVQGLHFKSSGSQKYEGKVVGNVLNSNHVKALNFNS